MFCTIETILIIEQMWPLYPEVSLFYPDASTYIICSKQEIPVMLTVVISISDTPPNQLYRLDHRTKVLVPLNGQVILMANDVLCNNNYYMHNIHTSSTMHM